MSEILLECKHIKKEFDNLTVLEDINLEVRRGEVLSIIGPSGSGKSTLLRCCTLLEKVDRGEIIYLGRHVCRMNESGEKPEYVSKDQLRGFHDCFGLVFQNFQLFPHYSVLRNITEAPIHVKHMPRAQAQEKARELLSMLGLADKADAYPYQLSGGQQQRVSIARALALNPQILFFDEPTSALDPELTVEVLKVIRALAAQHMTMVIVTHEMSFAREVSDKIVFMENGQVQAFGSPDEIFSSDQERIREFIGKLSD
ncbi:MAG: amino acid ABC transporter ATP-binding protein [Lachnospiraceae bacterium]|nr:amino acid ABC transporter ATP-binding protein [Lachnospiraceae bacterium]